MSAKTGFGAGIGLVFGIIAALIAIPAMFLCGGCAILGVGTAVDQATTTDAEREIRREARERETPAMTDGTAYNTAVDLVRPTLRSPSTASFPSRSQTSEYRVSRITDDTFDVRGYVDAQNAFGGTVREQWRVIFRPLVNGQPMPIYVRLGDNTILDARDRLLPSADETPEPETQSAEPEPASAPIEPEPLPEPEPEPEADPAAEVEQREAEAAAHLRLAKTAMMRRAEVGRRMLGEVVERWPGTEAAAEAEELLER